MNHDGSESVSRQRIRTTCELASKIRQLHRFVAKRPVGEEQLDRIQWIIHCVWNPLALYVSVLLLRRVTVRVFGSPSVVVVGTFLSAMSMLGVTTDTFEDGTIVEMARLYTTCIDAPAMDTTN